MHRMFFMHGRDQPDIRCLRRAERRIRIVKPQAAPITERDVERCDSWLRIEVIHGVIVTTFHPQRLSNDHPCTRRYMARRGQICPGRTARTRWVRTRNAWQPRRNRVLQARQMPGTATFLKTCGQATVLSG